MAVRTILPVAAVLLAALSPACGGDDRSEEVRACFEARAGETTYADLEERLGRPDRRRAVSDPAEQGLYEAAWETSDPSEYATVLFESDGMVRGTFCKPSFR